MSRLDLNIDLDAVARRLSFSSASPPQPSSRAPRSPRRRPALQPIEEDPGEQQAAETPAPASPWTSSPSPQPSQAPSCAPYAVPYQRPVISYAPVATIVPATPAPSVSPFQPQEAVAAASLRELEQRCQAELQQASAAAQPQLRQLRLYTVEGNPAGQRTKWEELHPMSQELLLQIKEKIMERRREAVLQLQQQAWAAVAAQAQPQQLRLYTVEGNPAGYKTKWEELHPVSQELLLQIEEKIRECRHESEQLDQCSRLYDPSVSDKDFELDASQITQEIGSISTIMDREKASIQSLMAVVREMMCNTDFAMRSYAKLRPRFVHRIAGIANAGFANHARSSGAPTDFNQPLTMAPTYSCYRGFIRRPSLFLEHIVARFEKQVEECCKFIGELEQLVQMKNDKTYLDSLESLPKVMSNVHDYFIHVASKVENLYQYTEIMRTQYLKDRRHRGNWNDPFLEADRKVAAKQEAAARGVYPTLTRMRTARNRC